MYRIRINILQPGDKVLSANGEFISIQRCNGEVDIIRIYCDENGFIRLDTENSLTIGYGDGSVEVSGEEDIKVETF